MPPKRRPRINYKEVSDEEDEGFNFFTGLLGFFMGHSQRKSAGKPRSRPSKRSHSSEYDCACGRSNKKSCNSSTQGKGKGKNSKAAKAAISTDSQATVKLDDSDVEIGNTEITETQVNKITNKVDNFFKALESDDDEDGLNVRKTVFDEPPEKKSKEFYNLSDSEEEKERNIYNKDKSITETIATSSSQPSTSDLSKIVNTGLKMGSNSVNLQSEKNTEDLFAYVDDLLNECNEVVDISDTDYKSKESAKESVTVLSLDDLKKKTQEILYGVESLIDDIEPKPKEAEPQKKIVDESPVKEAPMCPICLEQLGGSRQAMATLCGHMFCQPCILKVIRTTKKCPSCRKGLTKTKYHPVYI